MVFDSIYGIIQQLGFELIRGHQAGGQITPVHFIWRRCHFERNPASFEWNRTWGITGYTLIVSVLLSLDQTQLQKS